MSDSPSFPPTRNLHTLLASGFGSGFAPVASGTFGSAAAILAWWILAVTAAPAFSLSSVTLAFFVVCVAVGLWATHQVLKDRAAAGSTGKSLSDPSLVVIDEWAGMSLSLLPLSGVTSPIDWLWIAVAFFLFRLFDVLKPGPVRTLEQLPGAWGVMCDDVAAGAIAALLLALLRSLFGS